MRQANKARRENTVRAAGMAWRPVLVTAAALSAVFGFMAPASADGEAYSTDPGRRGARVYFISYDEIFRVYDRDVDGWDAVGKFQVWGGDAWAAYKTVVTTDGGGTRVSRDYEIGEGRRVRYQACLRNPFNRAVSYCSDWHYDRA